MRSINGISVAVFGRHLLLLLLLLLWAPLSVLPVLVVAAGADPVCSTPAVERFAARLAAGHTITIRGARHEILMERDAIREQFWAAFDAFVPGSATPVPGSATPVAGEAKAEVA